MRFTLSPATFENFVVRGELLDGVSSSLDHVEHSVVTQKVACSEGEKETLVGMGGEQLEDALSHAPIAFENQLLAEVIVDLLGHHFLVGRQSHVRHRRHLSRVVTENDGVQVAAIVMFDQIVSGVGFRIVAGSQRLLMVQRLVQGEDHLGKVESVEGYALLVDALDGAHALVAAFGRLGQVQIEDGDPSGFDVALRQRVDHEHDPDGSFALPVARYGAEQIIGVETAPPLVAAHPARHHVLHVIQVPLQPHVQLLRKHIRQTLTRGEKLTAGEGAYGVRIGEVQFEEDSVRRIESFLDVVGDVVPDARVRDVDRPEEVRRRLDGDPPQE